MGHRLSRIYTRTGDQGSTGLGDGTRIGKDAPRMETIGTVDELNSLLGILLTHPMRDDLQQCLLETQHDLFELGGELSIPGHSLITAAYSERLEQALDRLNEPLPPLKEFILPGGSPAAAACHHARSVCRRAERCMVALHAQEPVNAQGLIYLNRLSDLLFVLARTLARAEGGQEIFWQRKPSSDQE